MEEIQCRIMGIVIGSRQSAIRADHAYENFIFITAVGNVCASERASECECASGVVGRVLERGLSVITVRSTADTYVM